MKLYTKTLQYEVFFMVLLKLKTKINLCKKNQETKLYKHYNYL